MKKVTLLVAETKRQDMLKSLRILGAVHVKNVISPKADNLNDVESELAQTKKAINLLSSYKPKALAQKASWDKQETRENVKKLVGLHNELQTVNNDIEKLKGQMEWFKPWGGFDPADITNLSRNGVHAKLYIISKRDFQRVADRADIYIVSQQKHYNYIVQLSRNPYDRLPFKDIKPPEESFKAAYDKCRALQQRASEIDGILSSNSDALEHLKEHVKALERSRDFLKVKHGMAAEKGFSYLQGFIPADKEKGIAGLADTHSAGYLVEEPDNMAEVPTLVRNPRWIDIISPVFKFMNTVPGYAEYDISIWFLLFFSLFFAMLIGDAGYGLLFFMTTFLVRKRFKKLPAQPFFLMYALSFSTIIWGAITGTWFGSESLARLPLLNSIVIQDISSFADNNQNLMIFICFTIGVAQLTIAHLIIGLRFLNSLKALAELGWILVLWGLYFVAGTLVAARTLPGFTAYLFISGIALLLLFSSPQKNILKSIGASLTNVPLKVISSFGDVVSYLRLFAVGYASAVLASTFNSMAAAVGFNSIVGSLGAAAILFLGHSLNIILGFMAVIVHGVRLNMLEFSGQMGMEWSGKEYAPFKE